MNKTKVFGRSKEDNGNIIVKYDTNAVLNTMVYDVEFLYGSIRKYGENVISDNIYSQVDSEGFLHYIIYGILDFIKDTTTVQKGDQCITTKSGQHRMQKKLLDGTYLLTGNMAANNGYLYQL